MLLLCSIFTMLQEFLWIFANTLHIYPEMRNKLKKTISSEYSIWMIVIWNSKILVCSWPEVYFLIFYNWSYSKRCFYVAQRCGNRRWKWQHSFWHCLMLLNQRRNRQRWFNVAERFKIPTLTYTTLFQRWLDVVQRHNVIST